MDAHMQQYSALSVSSMRHILSRLRTLWKEYTEEQHPFHLDTLVQPDSANPLTVMDFCMAFVWAQHRPRRGSASATIKASDTPSHV